MESNKHKIISDWVIRYADTLYTWVKHRIKDDSLAEDLVQDTFLAAFQQFNDFRNESSPKTWLHAILKNKLTDHLRRQAKREFISYDVVNEFFDEEGKWQRSARLNRWDDQAEHLLDNTDFHHVLLACLHQLPESWSACMKLRYLEEKKAEEVCQELDINPTNYWQIIHRSKLRMRNCLQERWFKNGK